MTSRFWASSSDDSSVNSTGEKTGDPDWSHDVSSKSKRDPQGSGNMDLDEDVEDIGTVARRETLITSPKLPQQQSALLMLSMIEERCKAEAASRLADLPPDHPKVRQLSKETFIETKKRLIEVGMIPEELASKGNLQNYLSSFDTVLKSVVERRASKIEGLELEQGLSLSDSPQLDIDVGHPYANPSKALTIPSFFAFFRSGGESDDSIPESIYRKEYKEIRLLGSGGFGRVYLASSLVDDSIYAIKRITIAGKRLREISGRSDHEKMIAEVKALAKLNHVNVVRYYHCWAETHPRGGAEPLRGSHGNSSSSETESSFRSQAQAHVQNQDMVSFGDPSFSRSKVLKSSEDIVRFEESDDQVNDEASGSTAELVIRTSDLGQLVPYHGNHADKENEVDYQLYIKMTPYPMSLEEHIWYQDQLKPAKVPGVKHCFHTLPAVRLLLGILDGVEYLHRQKIIHRDLKPANIFLAFLPSTEPDTAGYIDISDCNECRRVSNTIHAEQVTRVCPVIGDFGLIHELKDPNADVYVSPAENEAAPIPYPFSGQAGTKFYCPPIIPKTNPICTRLDVYSLGIIAFELVYKFGTKSERQIILSALRTGVLPKDFEDHRLAEGIKAMLHQDRDQRWDCAQVRKWLTSLFSWPAGSTIESRLGQVSIL
ncbi:hypothetical protein LZ554_003279 [Drepanopeziza brunnea f. sp. 'monogermtubi']|nr:hypothetical protein LZ554_003279 [Drepanopeziza brunnea f. sp. 'monogermtubi']